MLNTGTITLWTAVASQLFLYVHHILRGQAGIAFLQLSRLNMRAKETLTATITFRDGLRCDKWSMLNDDDVDKNLSRIFDEWILGDPIQKLMERLFGKTDLPQGERRLLSQNPLLCASWRSACSYNCKNTVSHTSTPGSRSRLRLIFIMLY